MEFSQLLAFVNVAACASFSAASEKLHLTQPAVSKRIANLECQLSCRLFDRVGHKVLLTEAGKTLLPHARQLLVEWQNTQKALENLSGSISGTCRVVTSHHIGLHHLPAILQNMAQQHPQVDLHLAFTESEAAGKLVEQGEYDIAVITLPVQTAPILTYHTLWADPMSFVVGSAHPLAGKSCSITDLLAFPAVLPAANTVTRRIIEQAFAPHELKAKLSIDNLETIKMLVRIGFAWSCLPKTMLDTSVHAIDAGLVVNRRLGWVTHAQRTMSNATMAFMRCFNRQAD